ncbi:hypothetical protein CASFOL_018341 [Castilleja foliolosa]|uniref:Uncharacterized protein n=1 Tax=Castilleja foliolosa TaxID=1961234 RepID=A0ABD3D752_9LAMI
MDVWVIAAAAGAGYVAQRFKKLTMGNYNSSDSLSQNLEIASKSLEEEMCRQREMASTSGSQGENLVTLDDFGNWDTFFDLNRLPSVMDDADTSNSREIGVSCGFRRNRSSLRSRRVNSRLIKPRTALESCLMAQLYKEHAEMEEYTYSVESSQRSIVRPFLVADGNRVISRASHESCGKQTGMGNYKLRKAKTGNTGKMLNGSQNNAQGGSSSSDGSQLFYLGLTMGIAYSSLRHKLEIEKLTKSLKQSEDLVQDLHEELEMKDVSTLKELAVEDYNPYFNDDATQALSPEQKVDTSPRHCHDEESMRKIEAELEAELDRLESNFNSSKLDGKLSDVAELDQDFISDVIKDDLRADLFGAKTETHQAYADRDGSSSSTATATARSNHYPVSPRELSLRLHQVIQSRLEERIRELEMELEETQTKIKPAHKSPVASGDQPVVINLSGEALSSYNEVYDELTKLSDSDEGEESKQDDDVNNSQDESDDEMERLLIKQIVEKARQGSPAVLKVQRAFLSSDENCNWL